MMNLQPGQIIGNYKIISQLGKGGMATVYKAYQPSVERYVALKVLSFQLADSKEFLGRFKQEALLIARLEHPNILPIYDYGEENGIPYLVMRYLDAGTLKDRLQSASLPLDEINRIFIQVAEALEYAHENGVIHRDIKPSNIMLDRRGTVFLTDFGIAKMLEGTTQFTATGTIAGTPDYMSPEQAQGLKAGITSDVYSLGIVLYEMLTGKVPFDAETPLAVLLKHISHPLPPPSLLRPGLHPELEKVLLKALSKAPQDRYASMKAFISAWKMSYQAAIVDGEMQEAGHTLQGMTSQVEKEKPAVSPPQRLPVDASRIRNAREKPVREVVLKPETTGKPKKRTLVFAAVGLIALIILAGVGIGLNLREKTQVREDLSQASIPEVKPTLPGWTSWAASNTYSSLVLHDDELYAGGPGGITVWNKRTGEYRQITTQNGLPSARVMDIAFDDNDHMWVATEEGIARWDGDQWTWYDMADGLDNEYITTLWYWDSILYAGSNYAGDGGGLMRFDIHSGDDGGQWEKIQGFPSSETPDSQTVSYNVKKILVDNDEQIWAATDDGLARYDGTSWQVYKVEQGLPNNDVFTLFIDQKGVLWIGTRDGGTAFFDGDHFQSPKNLRDLEVYDVTSIVQDWYGALWFIGNNAARYDPSNGDWQAYINSEGRLPAANMRLALVDMDTESLFISSDGRGLFRATVDTGGEFAFTNWSIPGLPSYLLHDHILSVPVGTGKQQLIFTSPRGGVDVFDLEQGAWQPWLDPSSLESLWPYLPMPRIFDRQGKLWSGAWDGLWVVSEESVAVWRTGDGMPSNNVTAIALPKDAHGQGYRMVDDNHPAWIATSEGLVEFNGTRVVNVFTPSNSSLKSKVVTQLLDASDGTIWACEGTLINYRNPDGNWTSITTEELTGNSAWISDVDEARDGAIWLATHDGGLLRYQEGQWKNIRALDPGGKLPGDRINSITVAPDGSLWFGLDRNGAARLKDSNWTIYKDGLIHLSVNDIYVEENGTAWFATEGGISRLKVSP